jgi:hypothetical protein
LREHLQIIAHIERGQMEIAADLLRLHLRLSAAQRPQTANRGIPQSHRSGAVEAPQKLMIFLQNKTASNHLQKRRTFLPWIWRRHATQKLTPCFRSQFRRSLELHWYRLIAA